MVAYLTRSWTTFLPLVLLSILTFALARGVTVPSALPHGLLADFLPGTPSSLPRIGTAPNLSLMHQDGGTLSLSDLAGKVVLVTFIYTSCTDTCPLLTGKLAGVRDQLGPEFGSAVHFLSVTVDPERDTPDVLRAYAERFGADPAGWAFLTGTPEQIAKATRAYGIYVRRTPRGEIDHGFLTTLIDHSGTMRVQYLGTRFDPLELLADLRALLQER
jgi:protein SCO1/2